MTETQHLLAEYARSNSEEAFHELVTRYLDLVYSAALRLVDADSHLAEDVAQIVFTDLARMAPRLSSQVMLGGWLHRHTCFVARKVMRRERRRQARERQAVEMSALDNQTDNLALVAPILDEAIDQLGSEDRAAVVLRFFEQRDFKSVGDALGKTDEAARKRVDRALEKLEGLLKKRGLSLSASALAAALTAQAVSAAPAGLAASITTGALATAASGGASAFAIIQIMSMSKLKIGLVTAVVAAGVTVPLVMHKRADDKIKAAQQMALAQREQLDQLTAENQRLAALASRPAVTSSAPVQSDRELLKLRGEVGRLRSDVASEKAAAAARANAPSALSDLTANPEMYKVVRDQQKMGLGMIYKDFAKRIKLEKEMEGKLVDLLADDVMENVDRITELLRENNPQRMKEVFAAQEAALQKKVLDLLGQEGYDQYREYTRDLGSYLTAEQFKGLLQGEQADKDAKTKQLHQMMREETTQALAQAGLSADYQTVPSLNFRNFVSESETEKSLALLDSIYQRVTARADSVLTPEELNQFGTFRTNAINANRMALALNRSMMSPPK